ncbi:LysM peptidoglycan-binding domain-containing protein [Candidatus Berkelbacteria bacterium]|nr:LysM peptidoglycan-binding domain-containing protein [Candidatus Berkelbacteria bacterium]
MKPSLIVVFIIIIGFLTGSTLYFYNKSRELNSGKNVKTSFNGEVSSIGSTTNDNTIVDKLTKPADPKGRVSYPANVYYVQTKETLFAIGKKFSMSWQTITKANGITNENIVQAGYPLAIPKINKETDFFRIYFIINEDIATKVNGELRSANDSFMFSAVEVAKRYSPPFFNLKTDSTYDLLEQDLSKGTAVVMVKLNDKEDVLIGLVQPKSKGDKGFWTIAYIELQDE